MTINLPHELESALRGEVFVGHFASEEEAMVEAVRLLLREHRLGHPTPAPAVDLDPADPIAEFMGSEIEACNAMSAASYRAPHDWPSFFDLLRARPAMWFDQSPLTGLQFTLRGFRWAEDLYDVPWSKKFAGFTLDAFESWVADTFNPERLVVDSFWLCRQSTDTEQAGFAKWIDWYDQYQASRADE